MASASHPGPTPGVLYLVPDHLRGTISRTGTISRIIWRSLVQYLVPVLHLVVYSEIWYDISYLQYIYPISCAIICYIPLYLVYTIYRVCLYFSLLYIVLLYLVPLPSPGPRCRGTIYCSITYIYLLYIVILYIVPPYILRHYMSYHYILCLYYCYYTIYRTTIYCTRYVPRHYILCYYI